MSDPVNQGAGTGTLLPLGADCKRRQKRGGSTCSSSGRALTAMPIEPAARHGRVSVRSWPTAVGQMCRRPGTGRARGPLAPDDPKETAAPQTQWQQSKAKWTFAAVPAAAAPGCHCLYGVAPRCHSPAHYLWAMLLARPFVVLPLVCPHCGADMCIVAFITEAAPVEPILTHIGEPPKPPPIHAGARTAGLGRGNRGPTGLGCDGTV